MPTLEHDGWEVVTAGDDVIGATGPAGLVHATRIEGAMKTVSEWQVSLHVDGEPLVRDERVRIPVDADIWDWVDEQLTEIERGATM